MSLCVLVCLEGPEWLIHWLLSPPRRFWLIPMEVVWLLIQMNLKKRHICQLIKEKAALSAFWLCKWTFFQSDQNNNKVYSKNVMITVHRDLMRTTAECYNRRTNVRAKDIFFRCPEEPCTRDDVSNWLVPIWSLNSASSQASDGSYRETGDATSSCGSDLSMKRLLSPKSFCFFGYFHSK